MSKNKKTKIVLPVQPEIDQITLDEFRQNVNSAVVKGDY